MAAGPAKILPVDHGVEAIGGWQTCKTQSIAQTALTAEQLSRALADISFVEDTVEFIEVERFNAIRCQVWGVASNNDAPVINCYGWGRSGPGHHIGTLTAAYGNFTSPATTGFHASSTAHDSIKRAFAKDAAYRSCDTYAVTADYEQETVSDSGAVVYQVGRSLIVPRTVSADSPIHADFPTYFDVDLSRSKWVFFGMLVTTLAGTTLGGIFRPTQFRR